MSPSEYNSFRGDAELRDQPVTFISSPLRRVPSSPVTSRHTHHYSDILTDLQDLNTVTSLPSGKIYRKSMQYQKERKERRLRQLEELTGIKRDMTTSQSSMPPPSPSPLSRSQSLLLTGTTGSIGGVNSSISKIPNSPGSAFSAPPTSNFSSSNATLEALVAPTATSKARTSITEERHQDMILLAKALHNPPSLRTTQRLQDGLERSYPLSRMDAKKKRKEARFHLLTKKAQDYYRLKHEGSLPSISTASTHAKENHAPLSSSKSLGSATVSVATSQSSICSQGNRRRPISPAPRSPRSSDGSTTTPGGNSNKPDSESSSSSNATTSSVTTTSVGKPLGSFFTFGSLNCIMPMVDECSPVQSWPLSPSPEPTSGKDKDTSSTEDLPSSMPATEVLSNRDELLFPQTTRDELKKIRQELRVRKKAKRRQQSISNAAAAAAAISKATKKQVKIKVSFAEPIVTEVRHRPYTRPEDIEKLFFIEEELDELEWDRATVEGDQFEVALDELEKDRKNVSVTYKNKRSIIDRARNSSTGELIPFSPSDLSAIYE